MTASAAPDPPPSAPALRALADPFARLGPGATAALAALAVVLGLAASRAGVRFDGAMDVHVVRGPVPLAVALVDQAAALLAPTLVGWATLRVLGAQAPFGRLAASLGAARLALVLTAPLVLGMTRVLPPEALAELAAAGRVGGTPPMPPASFVVLALASVAGLVWFVALVAAALRGAAGVRGGRLAGATAATLLGGEAVAKLALVWLA